MGNIIDSSELPYGMVDINEVDFDFLVKQLERKYMFLSTPEAYTVSKLIKFYNDNKNQIRK